MPLVTGDPLRENGVIKANPLLLPSSAVNTVLVNDRNYTNTIVDLKWEPRINLLTHIEGSSWIVDYYSQIINVDSNLSGQQYTKNPVYQSYTLIKDMEMKVSSPLSTTQDAESKGMTVTGSALLYPFIIPNEGDMFVADIGEGKKGVFRITDSVKKSIFKEACYEINYGLNSDDNTNSISDLDQKVVKSYYFHKDFLTYGQNPLLVSSDNDVLINLDKTYRILAEQYFKKFFSNEFKTIMLPAQAYTVYDHFLVDFLLSEFGTRESPEIRYIRKLNLDDDQIMKCDSLWKALKYRDVVYLNTTFQKAGFVNARQFTRDPVLEGICYSGIEKVVYPIDPVLTVDYMQTYNEKELDIETFKPSPSFPGQNDEMIKVINLRGTVSAVAESIYPVTRDDCYVLSLNFYNKTTTMSVLESSVWNYLENKPSDHSQLLDTAKAYFKWGVLEQFYYIPIILTLIRSSIRGL